jgi:hypothetical protein
MPGSSVDPYSVPCPHCEAGLHERCFRSTTGAELQAPHKPRVKAAEDVARRARERADGDAAQRIEGARWRRLYSACRLELEQRADWTTLAAEQLETLVRLMAAADGARELAEAKPTVEGSTGQLVAHPLGGRAIQYDAQALAIARSLKLTPDTRGTSAPRPGDEDVPREDAPAEERDELAELDQLARKRKQKAAGVARRRG